MHELQDYIGRKGDKDYGAKYQHGYAPLKAKIEGLTDGEREGFLFLFLDKNEQAVFEDDTVDANVLDSLRLRAKLKIKVELEKAGLDGSDADKLLHRFDGESAKGQLDKTSTYKELSKLRTAKYYVTHKKLLHTLAQANGTDFYNIRTDDKLVKFIVREARRQSDRAQEGEDVARHRHHAAAGAAAATRPAADAGADDARLDQAHGHARESRRARRLVARRRDAASRVLVGEGRPIDHGSQPDRGVHGRDRRRYYAAVKHIAETKKQTPVPTTHDDKWPFKEPEHFTKKVLALMSSDKQSKIAAKDYTPAHTALTTGKPVSTDDRLEQAKFTIKNGKGLRKLGGNDAKGRSVVAAAEDLHGTELLEQWSNIDKFKALTTKEAKRDFILDVKDTRREWLKDNFTHADFVDHLKTIREHLREAAKDDKEFQARLTTDGVQNDDYAQERMHGLGELDRQRNLDSGLQVGMSANKGKGFMSRTRSNERKEGSSELIGEFRSAQKTLTTGTGTDQEKRDKVNEEHVPELQDKQEQLDRRTSSFLKARTAMASAIKIAVAIIVAAVIAGATMGFAAIPMTTATAIWLPFLTKGLLVLGAATLKQMVNKAIEGDNFNMRKAVVEVASQTFAAELSSVANT